MVPLNYSIDYFVSNCAGNLGFENVWEISSLLERRRNIWLLPFRCLQSAAGWRNAAICSQWNKLRIAGGCVYMRTNGRRVKAGFESGNVQSSNRVSFLCPTTYLIFVPLNNGLKM